MIMADLCVENELKCSCLLNYSSMNATATHTLYDWSNLLLSARRLQTAQTSMQRSWLDRFRCCKSFACWLRQGSQLPAGRR